ncbi:hypothetical protein ACJMK2_004625 [Sinanodonta woodiana]|uniref:Solute carrier organic anion transporter family member n=1 Tax=Sinanodonta woodiana TaxID=1069815 RepID=A0ABD3Y1R6_SINWO
MEEDATIYKVGKPVTDLESEVDVRCGYGQCKPRWLQKLNNPKVLLFLLCSFTLVQAFVINGLINVNTSTIERQFQLSSSRVGTISSAYDFTAAIIGVLTGFYGSRRNKARWLSLAAVAFGTGSLIMALPHFFIDPYQSGDAIIKTCSYNQSLEQCEEAGLGNYIYVLILGQCLHGVGGSILYTIGIVLLDDSVPATSSPLYLGILTGSALLGPGIGYIVGGQFLSIYVDFERVHQDSVRVTPRDPRWIGAWWLGFLVSCGLFWIIALPLSVFGAELPTARRVRETRLNQTYKDDGELQKVFENKQVSIRSLPTTLLRLLRNPTYVCIIISGACEGMVISGMATFLPKFLQNQFDLNAGSAALLTGAIAIPGSAGGTFVGGLLCRCLKLKVKGMTRIPIIACILAVICFAGLFVRCEQPKMAGVSQHYINRSDDELSLIAPCNSECSCKPKFYEPVCDSDGLRYFSSCYAGCSTTVSPGKAFSNCSCVAIQTEQNISMVTTEACQSGCSLVNVFLPIMCAISFFTFMSGVPSDSAILRCIHVSDRTFGMGVKWFFIRMAGSVPGPIIFGAITDLTCKLWNERCGERTSCWIYDNYALARNYFFIILGIKSISIIFFILANLLYVPPKSDVFHMTKEGKEQEAYENELYNDSLVADKDEANANENSVMSLQKTVQTRM